jgi:hypothetical protein
MILSYRRRCVRSGRQREKEVNAREPCGTLQRSFLSTRNSPPFLRVFFLEWDNVEDPLQLAPSLARAKKVMKEKLARMTQACIRCHNTVGYT